MKRGKEIKIGILAIVVVAILYWGYKFLIGKNVLSDSSTYKIVYHHVDQLTGSSPVMVHGFQVGMVTKIYLNPDNLDEVQQMGEDYVQIQNELNALLVEWEGMHT